MISIYLSVQTKYIRAQTIKLVSFLQMSRKDCMSSLWSRCVLSVDRELDVALLVVVLQQ